jgi:hypothetical protein
MRGFSCQYYTGNEKSVATSQRFFQSVRPASAKSQKGMTGSMWIWIGAALLLLAGVFVFVRVRKLRNH